MKTGVSILIFILSAQYAIRAQGTISWPYGLQAGSHSHFLAGGDIHKYPPTSLLQHTGSQSTSPMLAWRNDALPDQYLYTHRQVSVSSERIRKLKKVSIILAAVGGGLHLIGLSTNAAATIPASFETQNALRGTAGISNTVGAVVGIADIVTWIVYACELKKYKRQNNTIR